MPTELSWYDVVSWGVEGKGWADTESYFDRLPARAKEKVRPVIWSLSRQSAGLCVHFATDSPQISARWRLTLSRLAMPHMPASGVSGLDLYAQDDEGRWRWVSAAKPDVFPDLEKELIVDLEPKLRNYRLYLPLYNGVESLAVGVSAHAKFVPVPPRKEKPIVFYGSSIVQGAAASRPGMHHVAILGRRLDKSVINLGFSGNAHMEPEIADLLVELDPCVFVLDAAPNMNGQMVAERFVPFVMKLRKEHADTPIVLVEDRAFTNTYFRPQRQAHHAATHKALLDACEQLAAAGVGNLYFVPRENLFGVDDEASVDGSHPTDLGFVRMADALEPVLRPLMPAGA